MERLLIINPGSTSTKIAVYEDEKAVFTESIYHSVEDLEPYGKIMDQLEFRKKLVLEALKARGFSLNDLSAIIARGGILPPLKTGAYLVNEDMVWQLENEPVSEHASNLGAVIAYQIAQKAGISAYIYDAVSADEMLPILKLTGLPEIKRRSHGHNLNLRAAAMRYAEEKHKQYLECTLIIAHLGGGISISLHQGGKIIDIVNDEDGPFTPERAGALPTLQLIDILMKDECDRTAFKKKVKFQSGLVAYLGTNDLRKVEELMEQGNEDAELVYRAMAINVAKCIGKEAPVVRGELDAIILTGGMANSRCFTEMIKSYVEFLAPVLVYAGENEMESLALGGLRVLRKEEPFHIFEKNVE